MESGKTTKNMEEDLWFGLMDLYIKEHGLMIKLQGLEESFILMVTYIRAIGKQISLLVMVNTIIWMVRAIKVNGMRIYNTD